MRQGRTTDRQSAAGLLACALALVTASLSAPGVAAQPPEVTIRMGTPARATSALVNYGGLLLPRTLPAEIPPAEPEPASPPPPAPVWTGLFGTQEPAASEHAPEGEAEVPP